MEVNGTMSGCMEAYSGRSTKLPLGMAVIVSTQRALRKLLRKLPLASEAETATEVHGSFRLLPIHSQLFPPTFHLAPIRLLSDFKYFRSTSLQLPFDSRCTSVWKLNGSFESQMGVERKSNVSFHSFTKQRGIPRLHR